MGPTFFNQRPAMKLRTLPLTLALMAAFAGTAQAQSLATLYEAAKNHDATFKSADRKSVV